MSALPGVRSAGATDDTDLADDGKDGDVVVSGYTPPPNEDFDVELPSVSTRYLQTLGIPLLAGRYFNDGDTATSQHVADRERDVRETLFRQRVRGARPPRRPVRAGRSTDAVIIGVVGNVKHTSVRDPAMATSYTPFAQSERPSGLTYYIRTWQPPDCRSQLHPHRRCQY